MSAAAETLPGNSTPPGPPTASPAPAAPLVAPAPPSTPAPTALSAPAALPAPPAAVIEKHTVHWFRKGLRLHDNPALREGLANAVTFRCVFIIDPWFASSSNVGINKWRFLLQCLEDLDKSLRKLNSRLFVVRGQPADALPKLFREWGTTTLTFEEDPEPYGRVRDHNITAKCKEVGINVSSSVSHTLYKLDKIIERNGGKAPLTYHQFQALIASMPPPPLAETAISMQIINGATTPVGDDHDDRFGVPTLEELAISYNSPFAKGKWLPVSVKSGLYNSKHSTGFIVCSTAKLYLRNLLINRKCLKFRMTVGFETEGLKPPVWVGGESEALARLDRHLERKAWVATFGRPKMTPQSLLASQTGLSPYLRFGCLSTRLFYYQLTELYKRVKRVRPPLSLHGQILWREFFYCAATRNPNFDRMEGNPICVQIPWEKNQEALAKWANGQTGYPWIDAIMIQLREEGWIHHLARHAVACFLTRGDLWISWEEGMKVFDELLLDADWSVNAGMWMWLSCSSFFQQFFHCYCPVRFGRKTDPNGDYIRKYIPALTNMPTRYIHEPWVAPESVQQSARCIIGTDYPMPMVDHAKASQINLERIKQVYTQLAKYRPQGTPINPQILPTPSVMQSSPSPTSIITSINQSNYLCSQASEAQNNNNSTDDSNIFLRPTDTIKDLMKPPFKQVVIVQQSQHTRVATRIAKPDPNFIMHGQVSGQYKTIKNISTMRRPDKEENYDFKNLVIDNHIQRFPPAHGSLQEQSIIKTEMYQEKMKMDYQFKIPGYNPDKSKFYLSNVTENGEQVQNAHLHDVAQNFIAPSTLSLNYTMNNKGESSLDKTEGNSYAMNEDNSFQCCVDKGDSTN